MQVHEASLKFLNDPKSGLKTEGSKKNYRSDLMKLSQERDINSFTEQELLDTCFLPVSKGPREGQRPADSTVYARSKNFQGFFSYCHFMGWIKEDPTRHMKRHISGRGKPVIKHNWLTEDEVMRVLASVDMDSLDGPRDNIFLRLGFTAGLRISELANLRWSDISFDRREISLVGKGGKIAVVSISKNTFGYLHDWHGQAAVAIGRRPHDEMVLPRKFSVSEGVDDEGNFSGRCTYMEFETTHRMSNTTLGLICKRYSQLTGIKFTPHDMRRTFAGLMMEKVDIYQVSKAMRHSDVSTTEKYLQTRPDAAAQAVRDAGLDF